MTAAEAQKALEIALARYGQATYEYERWAARKQETGQAVSKAEADYVQAQSVPQGSSAPAPAPEATPADPAKQ